MSKVKSVSIVGLAPKKSNLGRNLKIHIYPPNPLPNPLLVNRVQVSKAQDARNLARLGIEVNIYQAQPNLDPFINWVEDFKLSH